MKASRTLKILQVSRPTLSKYIKEGTITGVKLPNGRWDYNTESVYAFLNGVIPRKTVIYGRVSTHKQKKDLETQIQLAKQFCVSNGWRIEGIFQDIASGISFEKRKSFFNLLDMVISNQIERVVISYKDRLSRVGFDLFKYLFNEFNTEIVVVSEVGSTKLDTEEVFEEIVSLLHSYSMKMYSNRRKKQVKDLCNPLNE